MTYRVYFISGLSMEVPHGVIEQIVKRMDTGNATFQLWQKGIEQYAFNLTQVTHWEPIVKPANPGKVVTPPTPEQVREQEDISKRRKQQKSVDEILADPKV